MESVNVELCTKSSNNKKIRNILGMNNSPRIKSNAKIPLEKEYFEKLRIKCVRHHDAAIENPSFELIDIHRIFPFAHLDENDDRNYFFDQTDDYLALIADTDIELEFRLGETIDHSSCARLIQPWEDINKWARVCKKIIDHYKKSEKCGLKLNLTRVCVWEEPDNHRLFAGDVYQYCALFSAVYKLVKKDYPDISVGGPALMGNIDFLKIFIETAIKNDTVPDFISFNVYTRSIDYMARAVRERSEILNSFGLYDTKLEISEWHLGPLEWELNDNTLIEGFDNAKSAAYCTYSLTALQDEERVETAFYYAWATSIWSVSYMNNLAFTLRPAYYGLLLFQRLGAECADRVDLNFDECANVKFLAGKTTDGKTRLLISCYEKEETEFKIKIGKSDATLYFVTDEECNTEIGKYLKSDESGNVVVYHKCENGVYLLEF